MKPDKISEAKNRLPMPDLMEKLGYGKYAKKSAKCPFHDDKKNSFSVFQKDGKWFWKCHARCGAGDEIDFIAKVKNLSPKESILFYLEMEGVRDERRDTSPKINRTIVPHTFNWKSCVDGLSDEELKDVAARRGLLPEFFQWLKKQALIGIYERQIAFPIHDENGSVKACHCCSQNGSWMVLPSGVTPMRPLIIGDPKKAKFILVFESQWDAFAVMCILGWHKNTLPYAVVITRGAGNGKLVKGYTPATTTVLAFKQNDVEKNGKRAGDEWLKDIGAECQRAGTAVKLVVTPSEYKDANDWVKDGASEGDINLAIREAKEITDAHLPVIYYDHPRSSYWIQNDRGGWISNNETQIKRVLRSFGVSPKYLDAKHVSPLDEILLKIHRERDVAYAGGLAGFVSGACEIGGRRILVTESPKFIEPVKGEWLILEQFLKGLLVDAVCDQRPFLFGWLKIALEALRSGKLRCGQALCVAGCADCGKSLLQNIITILLGGRSAKPYQFMSGGTNFNSDLFEAEHLMIEDEQASTDIRARHHVGAKIKELTVNRDQRCHAKNRVAITLTPFWRLSITVNDEPETLMVLPPIDDSLEDKIILLRASKRAMPMPTTTSEQRDAFWRQLTNELPAFVNFLLNWEIPSELVSERFGIRHYHHPQLLEAIDALAPETQLLNLIDSKIFKNDVLHNEWSGMARDLEGKLTNNNSDCAYEARKLLSFNKACGVYLGRLAKKHRDRVTSKMLHGNTIWTIKKMSEN